MRYLYHLTDTNTAKRILQEGLKPLIGERSRIVEEEEARIYLSDKKSIPYWKILLEKNVLLRIDAEKLNPEKLDHYPYQEYEEWTYSEPIQPEWIHVSRANTEISPEQYKELCLSFLDSISQVCVQFARYVSYYDDPELDWREYAENCKESCMSSCKVLQHTLTKLDFSCLDNKKLQEHLKAAGDGAYTLCDFYEFEWNDHPIRLWQLLGTHKLANSSTKWLYAWLRHTFPRKLRVNTGGGTG